MIAKFPTRPICWRSTPPSKPPALAKPDGFAVVADEVRALAVRTQTTVKATQDIVTKLTSGIDRAVGSMADSSRQAEQLNADSRGALSSINGMVEQPPGLVQCGSSCPPGRQHPRRHRAYVRPDGRCQPHAGFMCRRRPRNSPRRHRPGRTGAGAAKHSWPAFGFEGFAVGICLMEGVSRSCNAVPSGRRPLLTMANPVLTSN